MVATPRLPRPPRAARPLRPRPAADRHPRRPRRRPTWPASAAWPSRMNTRPAAGRARRSRPARSARSGSSTRSATCSSRATRRSASPGAMAAALADLEARLGPDADRLLDRFGEEFPGAGPEPEPPTYRLEELLLTRSPTRTRRSARSRADRRSARSPRSTRYGDAIAASRGSLRRRAADRRRRPVAHRAHAHAGPPGPDLAGRPAALHPGDAGAILLGASLEDAHPPARPRHRRSSPRRSARSTCGSVAAGGGGGTAGRPRRRRSGRPPPMSPRRSRPIRPGCRGSS